MDVSSYFFCVCVCMSYLPFSSFWWGGFPPPSLFIKQGLYSLLNIWEIRGAFFQAWKVCGKWQFWPRSRKVLKLLDNAPQKGCSKERERKSNNKTTQKRGQTMGNQDAKPVPDLVQIIKSVSSNSVQENGLEVWGF